ncbi:MAG: prolipoprotein diacylglyceryl transferase [Pseudomonadota bacterium]
MIAYPDIDPVAISLGPLQVHWYGLMYLFGFITAYLLGRVRNRQSNWGFTHEQIVDFTFYGALGTILGGRIGYFLFYVSWDIWIKDPLLLLKVWTGGMSFHGGLIGVAIASWAWSRHVKRSFLESADFVVPLVIPALGFGRLGNFIGGELWGRQAPDLPWGMIFPRAMDNIPRHPSQLYQMFLEGFVLFIIVWFYARKPRPEGSVTGLFLIGYGAFRFFIEFFRQPDAHLGFIWLQWMTMGQILCLPMIGLGLFLMWRAKPSANMKKAMEKAV